MAHPSAGMRSVSNCCGDSGSWLTPMQPVPVSMRLVPTNCQMSSSWGSLFKRLARAPLCLLRASRSKVGGAGIFGAHGARQARRGLPSRSCIPTKLAITSQSYQVSPRTGLITTPVEKKASPWAAFTLDTFVSFRWRSSGLQARSWPSPISGPQLNAPHSLWI